MSALVTRLALDSYFPRQSAPSVLCSSRLLHPVKPLSSSSSVEISPTSFPFLALEKILEGNLCVRGHGNWRKEAGRESRETETLGAPWALPSLPPTPAPGLERAVSAKKPLSHSISSFPIQTPGHPSSSFLPAPPSWSWQAVIDGDT